jgi:hypothetical protein
MAVDNHPLMPLARSFRQMPRHRNPVTNPAAKAALPSNLHPHVDAIASHPELAAVASGSDDRSGGMGPSYGGPPTGGSGSSFGSQGAQGMVQPSSAQFSRLPDVRHNILGMTALVFAGAGSAKGQWVPQTRFKGNRLIIPSSTLAGTTLTNMLVGTRPQYAANSVEAFDMFEEQSTSGMWDLDVCEIGQQITATFTVTAATTVYSCIIGEALDGKPYPMLRSPLKRIATQSVGVAAAGTVNVTITPQVRFKTRKLVCDDVTSQSFVINTFNVGISPQFMSGDPVPAGAFGETTQDSWLDCDEAYIGNIITLNVTNTSAGAKTFSVSLLGDVDPRDLQSAYGYY